MDFKFYKLRKNKFKMLLEWSITIIIALLIFVFILSNVVSLTQIKEQSMNPTDSFGPVE